jgi:hypothetical protein
VGHDVTGGRHGSRRPDPRVGEVELRLPSQEIPELFRIRFSQRRHEAEALLSDEDGLEALKDGAALARRYRVDGVPFFVVNGRLTMSGAQQPDAFLAVFRQATGSNG